MIDGLKSFIIFDKIIQKTEIQIPNIKRLKIRNR